MSDYYNRIMNILSSPESEYDYFDSKALAYKEGHRDARHAASEIVIEAELVIDDLLDALVELVGDDYLSGRQEHWQRTRKARDAIAKAKGLKEDK